MFTPTQAPFRKSVYTQPYPILYFIQKSKLYILCSNKLAEKISKLKNHVYTNYGAVIRSFCHATYVLRVGII